MPCFSPLQAWRTIRQGPGHSNKPVIGTDAPPGAERLELGCGKCIGCRLRKAQDWTIRNQLEKQFHEKTAFWTGTYHDDNLPAELRRDHITKFLKALRRPKSIAPIRFFACGEYGELKGRPHYHAILYGLGAEDAEYIESKWPHGFATVSEITDARIAYTAGYVTKKIHAWEPYHGIQKPFLQMSRNPGIAAKAKQWPLSWRLYAVQNGHKKGVPRYLHESYKQQATGEEIEQTKQEKLKWKKLLAETNNLEAQEIVTLARQHNKKRRAI